MPPDTDTAVLTATETDHDTETQPQPPAATDPDPRFPEWLETLFLLTTATHWLEGRLAPTFYRIAVFTMRWGMALVFVWFGAIKLFVPPPVTFLFTQELAFLPAGFPFLLGIWELLIGLCFVHPDWVKYGVWQLKFHMPGTFLPLVVIHADAFASFPFIPALPGLYILKNVVFVAGGFLLWYECVADKPFGEPPELH